MACYTLKIGDRKGFICGDLGPHCTLCFAPSEVLCDYPVGNELTCDRAMCEDCARAVGPDTHYCPDHFAMWSRFRAEVGLVSNGRPADNESEQP